VEYTKKCLISSAASALTAPHASSETPLPSFVRKRCLLLPEEEELNKTGGRDILVYSGIRRAQKNAP